MATIKGRIEVVQCVVCGPKGVGRPEQMRYPGTPGGRDKPHCVTCTRRASKSGTRLYLLADVVPSVRMSGPGYRVFASAPLWGKIARRVIRPDNRSDARLTTSVVRPDDQPDVRRSYNGARRWQDNGQTRRGGLTVATNPMVRGNGGQRRAMA